jgi:diguanylate cyclase (GGDEF)-like protein
MASDPSGQDVTPRKPSARWSIRGWTIWSIPPKVIGPVFTVELAALVLTAMQAVSLRGVTLRDTLVVALLSVLGVFHTEVALGVERLRRRMSPVDHHDLSSVWTFAGVVVLPSVLAILVALVIHSHLWLRAWRLRVPLYRHVFSTATIMLACSATSAVITHVAGDATGSPSGARLLIALCVGILVFATVNSALVAGAIAVTTPRVHASQLVGEWDENVQEIATLCLGAITAVAVLVNPWLVLLVLPPLLVLHRAVLVRQLEEEASTDGKTGLLNAAAWHARAERALRRSHRDGPGGVLVLDLDHFKAVNDTHGHLAGDHVLAAVAAALRAEVRERDLVGRFGGEEFVVLLAGLAGGGYGELETVAERIRRHVANLRVEIPTPDGPLTIADLSISVGAAVHTEGDPDLQSLLQIADAALYAAKGAGRNTVRMGLAVPAAPLTPMGKRAGGAGATPTSGIDA